MLESSTYRLVIEEGRAEGEARGEARGRASDVLELVRHRLGRVPRGLQGKLKGMNAEALGELFKRALRSALKAEDPQQLRALLSRLPRRS
jgi:predicted transposase YdaD